MIETFNNVTARWPNHTKVYKLSETTWGGRELWVLQISTDVNKERSELKPMFKYVANMHGNEAVGRELLLALPEFLLQRYFSGHNIDIETLINTTDIHLLITMNPDGFERATLGDCWGYDDTSGRKNERNVDLNRNFPTQQDLGKSRVDLLNGREPETRSVMRWILDNPFVLSINFHDGAVVSNYPFDDSAFSKGVISPTPDHKLFKHLATIYASNHEDMFHGVGLCNNDNFPGGITNGAEWYVVKGGMQDFNYLYTNCFELTVELSCCKYPQPSRLKIQWRKNVKSLVKFIQSVHIGIKGIVSRPNHSPAEHAKVIVEGNKKVVKTTERGEYWRLLLPGIYYVYAETEDKKMRSTTKLINITSSSNAIRVDFKLAIRDQQEQFSTIAPNIKAPDNSNCSPFQQILNLLNLISAIIFTFFN